jgi:uncharacterized protein YndB with AHSA1/START domain
MMRFTNTIAIHRRPADVFAFLAQLENLPQWNYAISETRKVSAGPVGVGSKYVQTRTVPSRSEEAFEVTEYEPDRRLSISGTLGRFPTNATYLLEAVGDGTRLTNDMDLRPPGVLGVVAPLATSRVKAAVAENLAVLKQLLE